ncbi:hypothetical protein AVEN_190231-1 [Araneus ventricosus]|uniref:Uncharacterized protein n=2 Tax=Araneus ventricosus TaxID=182803 RepID=A0A4Y2FDS8_ARAVE|nr:hypothetical protein AVEN_190231-1 [Araneus ventricosus]
MDFIRDKILKSDARRKPGGVSAAELEGLEERVEELEEAREVFEEDHLKLSDVQKTQKEMVEEFEEIKALGSEIKVR